MPWGLENVGSALVQARRARRARLRLPDAPRLRGDPLHHAPSPARHLSLLLLWLLALVYISISISISIIIIIIIITGYDFVLFLLLKVIYVWGECIDPELACRDPQVKHGRQG